LDWVALIALITLHHVKMRLALTNDKQSLKHGFSLHFCRLLKHALLLCLMKPQINRGTRKLIMARDYLFSLRRPAPILQNSKTEHSLTSVKDSPSFLTPPMSNPGPASQLHASFVRLSEFWIHILEIRPLSFNRASVVLHPPGNSAGPSRRRRSLYAPPPAVDHEARAPPCPPRPPHREHHVIALIVCLFRSSPSVMPIFSFCAHASCRTACPHSPPTRPVSGPNMRPTPT